MSLQSAIAAGIAYVLQQQQPDGHWEDFALPVGSSDAWVTAYVGFGLAATSAWLCQGSQLHQEIAIACQRAAQWLQQNRLSPAGWGFNSTTEPDADSTANALLLLRDRLSLNLQDVRWLHDRWQSTGGFATYASSDAWGIAHPCVTPLAFLALPLGDQAELRSEVLAYLQRGYQPNGTWPAYWWRTCHYSTYWNLLLLQHLGQTLPSTPHPVGLEDTLAIYGAFDLAYVVGITALKLGDCGVLWRLAEELVRLQNLDGSWSGSYSLRVTQHDCEYPWIKPVGQLFCDHHGLLTTATAIRMLSHVMETSCR